MPDDIKNETENGEGPPALDRTVQEHLGQKLRAAYAEVADKPAYLGDPALPPEFEHQLLQVERSEEVHEKAVEAVREVLGLSDTAREKGLDAVKQVLLPDPPPRK